MARARITSTPDAVLIKAVLSDALSTMAMSVRASAANSAKRRRPMYCSKEA